MKTLHESIHEDETVYSVTQAVAPSISNPKVLSTYRRVKQVEIGKISLPGVTDQETRILYVCDICDIADESFSRVRSHLASHGVRQKSALLKWKRRSTRIKRVIALVEQFYNAGVGNPFENAATKLNQEKILTERGLKWNAKNVYNVYTKYVKVNSSLRDVEETKSSKTTSRRSTTVAKKQASASASASSPPIPSIDAIASVQLSVEPAINPVETHNEISTEVLVAAHDEVSFITNELLTIQTSLLDLSIRAESLSRVYHRVKTNLITLDELKVLRNKAKKFDEMMKYAGETIREERSV